MGEEGIRWGLFAEVPPRTSREREIIENPPKVAGLGRESNPGLLDERCVG